MALVETRRRTLRPSASEMKVTLHRFGRNRRLVLILEWLTLWPTCGLLAVSSQRRDILRNPLPSPGLVSLGGSKSGTSWERRTYRGSAAGRQGFGPGPAAGKGRFRGRSGGFAPSYKRRIRRRHDAAPAALGPVCPKSAPASICA